METNRRGFLRSCAAVSTVAHGVKPAQRNWQMIVGGNRCGKSTLAAKECLKYHAPHLLAWDYSGAACISKSLGLNGFVKLLSGQLLEEHSDDSKVRGDFLWIDEICDDFDVVKLADKFDRVLWTTWPHADIQDCEFYQECKRNGNVQHMQTLPRCRHKGWIDSLTTKEYRTRVLGEFETKMECNHEC